MGIGMEPNALETWENVTKILAVVVLQMDKQTTSIVQVGIKKIK